MKSRRPFRDRKALTHPRWLIAAVASASVMFAHAASGTPEAVSRDTSRETSRETAASLELPTAEARTLYTLGQLISRTLDTFSLTSQELEWVKTGLVDGVLGATPKVDLAAEAAGLHAMQQARREGTLARERAAGAEFAAAIAKNPRAERLPNGLVIEPVQQGSGETPTDSDHVRVHYEGQLIDGTVFDSSRQRGAPSTFPLRGVIGCWTEALRTMRVGGRSRIVCPAELAYGERGSPPTIRPGATLIFDIELLAIVR